MPSFKVLVVDADAAQRASLRCWFENRGHELHEASTVAAARRLIGVGGFDVALLDCTLVDADGFALLREVKRKSAHVNVVVASAVQSVECAVRAMKAGAHDFIKKPVDDAVLQRLFGGAIAPEATPEIDPFTGTSTAIRRVAEIAQRLVESNQPILILGETGAGKGVLARWLHRHSSRARGPFVDLNCGGFSREFLESELFGHEKGAFTGAVASKPGMLEIADGGTVFLDEIGDMDAQVQPKLVKVLEEKRFHRIGDVHDRCVDVHLIAATNQDLAQLVVQRAFRSDLFFRISAFTLVLPPLRERLEDLAALAQGLLDAHMTLSDEALRMLESHPWTGNIRELKNVLRRAELLCGGDVIHPQHVRFDLPQQAVGRACCCDTSLTLRALEHHYIDIVLREENGRVEGAARRLGVPRSSLYQKLKALGLRS